MVHTCDEDADRNMTKDYVGMGAERGKSWKTGTIERCGG